MSVMWPLHPSSTPPTHTSQRWRQNQVKEYFAMPATFEKQEWKKSALFHAAMEKAYV